MPPGTLTRTKTLTGTSELTAGLGVLPFGISVNVVPKQGTGKKGEPTRK